MMAKSLVIVESPAKAKTINKYLGKDYVVEASIGHIMDLPKNKIGVDLEHGTFEPDLIVMPGKEKVVDRLKKLATYSQTPSIWHLIRIAKARRLPGTCRRSCSHSCATGATIQRVTFNEITQKAVKAAFQHAGKVDARSGGRAADAARAGSHRGLSDFSAALG